MRVSEAVDSATAINTRAAEIVAAGPSAPRVGRDPVNQAMINNWTEALGFSPNPARGVPAAMIQVWTMAGLHGVRAPDDPLGAMMTALDDAGFTSVVATDCNQTYVRELRPGDIVFVMTELETVVGPKTTALGTGYFVTTRSRWLRGDELIAEMTFRVLKYTPSIKEVGASVDTGVMRPVVSQDTQFFWDGTAAHELRVQRGADGSLLHPPIPRTDTDPAAPVDYVVASGTGSIHSFVVHHHPQVPGRRTPYVVALVDLDEGVRMLGELRGVAGDQVRIGMSVSVDFDRIDDELTIPYWRVANTPVADRRGDPVVAPGAVLPPMVVHADPTFVVSTALATRDFQDVHHDRDKAIERGSPDIFVNILTDTGMVARFVEEWTGPGVTLKSIALRLGVPWYANDTITFTGEVTHVADGKATLSVIGSNSLGKHVIATVEIATDETATSGEELR